MSDDVLKGLRDIRIPSLPSYDLPAFAFDAGELRDESASGLLEALDKLVGLWKRQLPADAQPTILAILANGSAIEAHDFAEAGHHGIGIRGRLDDGGECLVLVHQSSLQLVCRVVKTEDPRQRYQIGFSYSGKASDES